MRTPPLASSAPAAHARAPRADTRRPFAETLRRAAREPPPRPTRTDPGARDERPLAVAPAAPQLPGASAPRDPTPPVAAPAGSAVSLERARLAVDGLALRDRAALELRFGADAVRLDATAAGVELRVDAGPRAVQGALDPAALADAVRARGVPVVRAEVRAGGDAERRDGRRPRR